MHLSERRQRFRAILAGSRCVYPASVYDPVSVRMAESLGFEAGMLAGSIASLTVLGAPDLAVLTLSELAEQVMRICRASELPLMVDADHGYGNALSAKRTVEELETAGVAALTIEDTALPAPYGTAGRTTMIAIEEGAGKMRAALAGRHDPALVVVGRTSALIASGLDDAVVRVRAYAECGVDAIFVVGVRAREQLDAIAAATKLPLMLGGVGRAVADPEYLASRNVRVAVQGHTPVMAGIRAVHAALKALREGVAPNQIEVAPPELVKLVTRDDDYQRWLRDFLGSGG